MRIEAAASSGGGEEKRPLPWPAPSLPPHARDHPSPPKAAKLKKSAGSLDRHALTSMLQSESLARTVAAPPAVTLYPDAALSIATDGGGCSICRAGREGGRGRGDWPVVGVEAVDSRDAAGFLFAGQSMQRAAHPLYPLPFWPTAPHRYVRVDVALVAQQRDRRRARAAVCV